MLRLLWMDPSRLTLTTLFHFNTYEITHMFQFSESYQQNLTTWVRNYDITRIFKIIYQINKYIWLILINMNWPGEQ